MYRFTPGFLSSLLLLASCGTSPVTVSRNEATYPVNYTTLKVASLAADAWTSISSASLREINMRPTSIKNALYSLGRTTDISRELNFSNGRQNVSVEERGDLTITSTTIAVPFYSAPDTFMRIRITNTTGTLEREDGAVRGINTTSVEAQLVERVDFLTDGVNYAQFVPEYNQVQSVLVSNESGGIAPQSLGVQNMLASQVNVQLLTA
ncbi:hypothetical protein [Deinococcus sp. S9]|uniref:hypothetical protein n=1 Tax=Deinococcus sp. S9 TaxID=2545754 RepID=UPI0010569A39|nr:hypothetical protein [Deinococcus sp. S9]TDE84619.1 hypothetical protein E0686_16220 [Deinococcus sp. S9]